MLLPHGELTKAARTAIERATYYAACQQALQVEPEHLLLSLLTISSKEVREALGSLQIDPEHISQALGIPLQTSAPNRAAPPLSPIAEQVIRSASKEALHLGHDQVDAVHLLSGILYEQTGQAYQVLQEAGLSLYDLRQHLKPRGKHFKRPLVNPRELASALRPSPIFLIPLGILAISGLALFFGIPEQFARPFLILFVISGWIVSLCFHEFAHALVAYLGGDLEVKDAGYLTLNPLRYTDPFFSLILPIIFLLMGGIGLPGGAVYIRPLALRSRGWQSMVSAAGPIATAIFCLLTIWPFFFDWSEWVTEANMYFWPALAFLGFLELTAVIFNLLPIPPLDGFGIIAPSLSWETQQRAKMAGNMFFFLLLFILWGDNPINNAFWDGIFGLASLLQIPIELLVVAMDMFSFT